jgi:hypothetical protein
LPTTLTFVALSGGEVVGTLALVVDSPLGLPMERSFREEIDAFRARGERIAEASALAVAPAHRKTGLVYLLNRAMVRTAMAVGMDRLVMTVHPRAQTMYKTALLFESCGSERPYAGLTSAARAVAMSLPLAGLPERYRDAFGARGPNPTNAAWLYIDMPAPWIEEVDLPRLLRSEERIEALEALARARLDVFKTLSGPELAYLRRTLNGVLWPAPSRPAIEIPSPLAAVSARS